MERLSRVRGAPISPGARRWIVRSPADAILHAPLPAGHFYNLSGTAVLPMPMHLRPSMPQPAWSDSLFPCEARRLAPTMLPHCRGPRCCIPARHAWAASCGL